MPYQDFIIFESKCSLTDNNMMVCMLAGHIIADAIREHGKNPAIDISPHHCIYMIAIMSMWSREVCDLGRCMQEAINCLNIKRLSLVTISSAASLAAVLDHAMLLMTNSAILWSPIHVKI